jgi:hypothetical protein
MSAKTATTSYTTSGVFCSKHKVVVPTLGQANLPELCSVEDLVKNTFLRDLLVWYMVCRDLVIGALLHDVISYLVVVKPVILYGIPFVWFYLQLFSCHGHIDEHECYRKHRFTYILVEFEPSLSQVMKTISSG